MADVLLGCVAAVFYTPPVSSERFFTLTFAIPSTYIVGYYIGEGDPLTLATIEIVNDDLFMCPAEM